MIQQFQLINFRKKRDFSQKLNATIEFIRQNFRGLTKSIIFIAGPVILLASIALGVYQNSILGFQSNPDQIQEIESIVPVAGFMMLFFSISYTMVITIINEYINIYLEKQTNQIEPQEVWLRVKKDFLMIFITSIGYWILIIIAFFFLIIPGIYFWAALSIIFIVQVTERKGFFDAFSRCLKLISGKWWSTFGIYFVSIIISVIISYLFAIPMYIVSFAEIFYNASKGSLALAETSMLTKILTIIFTAIYVVASHLLYMIPFIAIAFQYFNLVERKESVGLMEKIDDFGSDETMNDEDDEDY